MAKTETNKKTMRLKAGDVVTLHFNDEDRPCEDAMALLLTPVTVNGDGMYVGKFRTMHTIDVKTEKFLPAGPIKGANITVNRATAKLKAWYFEQILNMCKDEKPAIAESRPENIWVLFDESLYDYELQGRRIMVFTSEDEARKKFKEFAKQSRKFAKDNGWEIGNDNDDFFEAYPEGSWGTSHETVELSETVFNDAVWCHE